MTDQSSPVSEGLLPCPFCGNRPRIREPFGIIRSGYQIACNSDDCFGPHTTAHDLDDCIIQWNTRPAQAARTSTTTPVCCYCDAPLSCASCGREQPDDAAQPPSKLK